MIDGTDFDGWRILVTDGVVTDMSPHRPPVSTGRGADAIDTASSRHRKQAEPSGPATVDLTSTDDTSPLDPRDNIMPMHRAGDTVTVLCGPDSGRALEISAVRVFAADNGYYLRGGAGLYRPDQVTLAHHRIAGNPCGSPCTEREHAALGSCGHCRGICGHASRRRKGR
ncbi:hypothetical protein [Nocardia nova]|uniref:hypothetical protein n=1 Tax=Nocardia nova TaxID=37330 RepID=UPI0034112577